MQRQELLKLLKHCLVVSCQAPQDSPLHDPLIIAAMAQVAVNRGAAAVRIDTPAHVQAVRRQIGKVPIIGLWKQQLEGYEVYITPRFSDAVAIAEAGADIIAIDATLRSRPQGETVASLIPKIQQELGKMVMADVDTPESALAAAEAGADLIGTTLFSYTHSTQNQIPPGWDLLRYIVNNLPTPAICEGGIASPQMGRQALEEGAYAIVVGGAITGIDDKVKQFHLAINSKIHPNQ